MIEYVSSFYYSLFYLISSSEEMVFNFSKILLSLQIFICLPHSFFQDLPLHTIFCKLPHIKYLFICSFLKMLWETSLSSFRTGCSLGYLRSPDPGCPIASILGVCLLLSRIPAFWILYLLFFAVSYLLLLLTQKAQ